MNLENSLKISEYFGLLDKLSIGVVDILYSYLGGTINLARYINDRRYDKSLNYTMDFDKVQSKFDENKTLMTTQFGHLNINWFCWIIREYIRTGHISDMMKFYDYYWTPMIVDNSDAIPTLDAIIRSGDLNMYNFCLRKGLVFKDTKYSFSTECPSLKMIRELKLKVPIDFKYISYTDVQQLTCNFKTSCSDGSYLANPDLDVIKYIIGKLGISKNDIPKFLISGNIPALAWVR